MVHKKYSKVKVEQGEDVSNRVGPYSDFWLFGRIVVILKSGYPVLFFFTEKRKSSENREKIPF